MSKSPKSLLSSAVAAAVAAAVCFLSFSCSSPEDGGAGSAQVRYTWAESEFPYIQSVAASYNDVNYWYTQVYSGLNYSDESATGVPSPGVGSSDIPDKLYSRDRPSDAKRYWGVYLPISAGAYTAVCTVIDPVRIGTIYIVANYRITAGKSSGETNYYEVAFDVEKARARAGQAGQGDSSWVWGDYGNNSPDTLLIKKAPAAGVFGGVGAGGVVYRVLRKP